MTLLECVGSGVINRPGKKAVNAGLELLFMAFLNIFLGYTAAKHTQTPLCNLISRLEEPETKFQVLGLRLREQNLSLLLGQGLTEGRIRRGIRLIPGWAG